MARNFPFLLLIGLAFGLLGCQAEPEVVETAATPISLPTTAPAASTLTPTADATVPVTWTPQAVALEQAAELGDWQTPTPGPTSTPWPTFTPTPTDTPTPTPTATDTPIPPPTPLPTSIFPTPINGNYLPNASFEQGWYHLNGDPELQIPEMWTFEYEEGRNSLDPDPWNRFVRPEVRVLPKEFLPAAEHETFIWDGSQTLKVFKGEGAISFRLISNVYLEPGNYTLKINVYPDLVEAYAPGGAKIWASDPLSGEIQFRVDGRFTPWQLPGFGQKNTLTHSFTVTEAHTVPIAVAMRGRWAIENNGWFMDDWRLSRNP